MEGTDVAGMLAYPRTVNGLLMQWPAYAAADMWGLRCLTLCALIRARLHHQRDLVCWEQDG